MAKRKGGPAPGSGEHPSRSVVEDVTLAEVTRTRYLNYALSVITSRALPDVRDGLKPVQRRILYTMWSELGIRPDSRYIKCAEVVGRTMGSYHPHGDQSIYQALVRMAQPFSLRYPLIAGYGNFGSLDGDEPAAMRYTECRLMPISEEMLSELGQETVNFKPNYASTTVEPEVLPAQFPNLLINGVSGIAVGMATNIPPHNLKEIGAALVTLLDNREAPLEKICRHVLGPDFPTGGVILNSPAEIQQIYAVGQGSIKLRGTYMRDPDKPNSVWITSIPYGIEKDALVLRIGELIGKGLVPQLTNVKDLSTEDVRIALELRPGANLEAAMAYLFKNTPLQTNFGVNMTCLLPAAGAEVAVPDRLDLKSMLLHFLDFRLEVVTRRLRFELNNLLKRIHILEGFAIVFNALDEAIAIIRASNGKADASPKLMERFLLSYEQTDAILETKLYRLGKLEIAEILGELEAKRSRAGEIQALLDDEPARWKIIRTELKEIVRAYGDDRRTTFAGETGPQVEYREEDYIIDEDAWVIVTRDGWIKRQKSFTDVASIRVRDDDIVGWVYRSRARQTLTFFTDRGIAYTMRVNDIPLTTGHGETFRKGFALDDGEHLVGVACHDSRCMPPPDRMPALPHTPVQGLLGGELSTINGDGATDGVPPGPYAIALTSGGKVLRFPLSTHAAVSNRKGRLVVRLDPVVRDDKVVGVEVSDGHETVCLATRSARVLIFPVSEANVVSAAAKGVTAIKLKGDDRVIGFALAGKMREGLTVRTNRGATQIVRATKYPVTGRGGLGFGILQRGSLDAIIHDEAQPVPPVETINE
jgi:DNA gyrase subunit A